MTQMDCPTCPSKATHHSIADGSAAEYAMAHGERNLMVLAILLHEDDLDRELIDPDV